MDLVINKYFINDRTLSISNLLSGLLNISDIFFKHSLQLQQNIRF